MSREITTEILAKAIDTTKDVVQTKDDKVTLVIQNQDIENLILNRSASDKDNQLNAVVCVETSVHN